MKRCTRCGGQLFAEEDSYGPALACLQCGFRVELDRQGQPIVVLPHVEGGNRRLDEPIRHRLPPPDSDEGDQLRLRLG